MKCFICGETAVCLNGATGKPLCGDCYGNFNALCAGDFVRFVGRVIYAIARARVDSLAAIRKWIWIAETAVIIGGVVYFLFEVCKALCS